MEKSSLYYKESGQLGTMGPTLMGIGGLIASLVLGAIYAYATFYIPFIYINFLITLGLGIGLGFVVGKAALIGKVRNQRAVVVFALVAGVLAEFFNWVFWIHAAFEQEMLTFSFSAILDVMQVLAEEGAWSVFGITPSGIMLYLVWLIEAGIIIGTTTLIAMGHAIGKPFCENCDRWVDTEVVSSRLARIIHPAKLVEDLENQDFTTITALEQVEHNATRRTKLELSTCKNCEQDHYLSVTMIDVEIDNEGKAEEKEDILVENLETV